MGPLCSLKSSIKQRRAKRVNIFFTESLRCKVHLHIRFCIEQFIAFLLEHIFFFFKPESLMQSRTLITFEASSILHFIIKEHWFTLFNVFSFHGFNYPCLATYGLIHCVLKVKQKSWYYIVSSTSLNNLAPLTYRLAFSINLYFCQLNTNMCVGKIAS
jgi:hypothetical protein